MEPWLDDTQDHIIMNIYTFIYLTISNCRLHRYTQFNVQFLPFSKIDFLILRDLNKLNCEDNQRRGMLVSSIYMRDPSSMSSVKPQGTYPEFHPVLTWEVNCFQTTITVWIWMSHYLHVKASIWRLFLNPLLW